MAQELEIKLHLADLPSLDRVLSDESIALYAQEAWDLTPMETTYFDTADRRLQARKWMLRRRMEGERSVVCFKTPSVSDSRIRGEWEVEADDPAQALPALLMLGAPPALQSLLQSMPLLPTCGARFLRRFIRLQFPDGSCCILSGDHGELFSDSRSIPFSELELELACGAPDAMLGLAQTLMQTYGLHEEPRSKFARAAAL